MRNVYVNRLPFSKENEIDTLIENRRTFSSDFMELHVYETYESSKSVPLVFDDMVMINMVQGKKIMHLDQLAAFDYLPGQMLVLPAYQKMHIDFPEATLLNPTQCTALTISRDKLNDVADYLAEASPQHQLLQDWKRNLDFFRLYNTPELVELLNKLFRILMSGNALKNVYADLVFKELTIRLLQAQSLLALDIRQSSHVVLTELKEFIQKHIAEKITMESLQKVAHLSKSSLSRLFQSELGLSPMEFVIRQRIDKSKKLLKLTKSVKEACYATGFNDVNYFVRIFKNREGMTPGAFIKQVT